MSRRNLFYQPKRGDNLADPEFWKVRFDDIDLRLAAREQDAESITNAINTLNTVGLQRLNDTFTPLIQEAQEALNTYGISFHGESVSTLTVATGALSLTLTAATRDAFYYADWVSIRSTEDTGVSMLALVNSYVRTTGVLDVNVQSINGSGSYSNWEVRIGAPLDETHSSRTDNPHSTTAAQVGAYTIAETQAAIDAAIDALPPISNVLLQSNNLSDLTDKAAARTALQLGQLASENTVTIGLLSSNLLATVANVLAGSASKLATTDVLLAASAPVAMTDAAQIAVNLASLVYGTVTIAASRTLANPTGHKVGRNFYIKVKQPAGGNCTLSYDTQYDFGQSTAPVLSTAGDAEDLLAFFTASTSKIVYLGIRKGV